MSSVADDSGFQIKFGKLEFIALTFGVGLGLQTLMQHRRIQSLIMCRPEASTLSCVAKCSIAPLLFSTSLFFYHYEFRRRVWRYLNERNWGVYYARDEVDGSIQKRVPFGFNSLLSLCTGVVPVGLTVELVFHFYKRHAHRFSHKMMQRRYYAIGAVCLAIVLDAMVDDFSDCFEEHQFLTLDTLYDINQLTKRGDVLPGGNFDHDKEEEKLGIKNHLKKHIRERRDEL